MPSSLLTLTLHVYHGPLLRQKTMILTCPVKFDRRPILSTIGILSSQTPCHSQRHLHAAASRHRVRHQSFKVQVLKFQFSSMTIRRIDSIEKGRRPVIQPLTLSIASFPFSSTLFMNLSPHRFVPACMASIAYSLIGHLGSPRVVFVSSSPSNA